MKTWKRPEYPRIARADLSLLKLDPESAKLFERRFLPGSLGSAAFVFGGMGGGAALHHFGFIADWAFALCSVGGFILGLGLALWTHHLMMRALPRSAQGGRTMQAFVIGDLDAPDRYELAYVDQQTGTYFKRLYVERG